MLLTLVGQVLCRRQCQAWGDDTLDAGHRKKKSFILHVHITTCSLNLTLKSILETSFYIWKQKANKHNDLWKEHYIKNWAKHRKIGTGWYNTALTCWDDFWLNLTWGRWPSSGKGRRCPWSHSPQNQTWRSGQFPCWPERQMIQVQRLRHIRWKILNHFDKRLKHKPFLEFNFVTLLASCSYYSKGFQTVMRAEGGTQRQRQRQRHEA